MPWRYDSNIHAYQHYHLMGNWPWYTNDERYPWLSAWSHRTLLELLQHGPLGTQSARPVLAAGDRQVQQLSSVLDCVRACDFESHDIPVPENCVAECRPPSLKATSDIWPVLESDSEAEGTISQLRASVDETLAAVMDSIQDGSWLLKTDTVAVWHQEHDTREWATPGTYSQGRHVRRRRA